MSNLGKKILYITLIFIVGVFSIFCINSYVIRQHNYRSNVAIINLMNEYNIDIDGLLDKSLHANVDYSILNKYGLNLYEDSIIKDDYSIVSMNVVFVLVYSLVLFIIYLYCNKLNENRIKKLIHYIEQINSKNYSLDIKSNTDDSISLLQNEIYKTMVYLNEVASLSIDDKRNIKKNLEDITHQIKTPLTSILINLDNLIGSNDMDELTKQKTLSRVYKDAMSIQILIHNLLKLSKFDVNSIKFKQSNYKVIDLIDDVIEKVSPVIDLYDVNVIFDKSNMSNLSLHIDYKWQVEALSNIVKNACESECNNIEIVVEDNPVYTYIKVVNDGSDIDENIIPRIFERFTTSSRNTGIGLALTKKIIELDNGTIVARNGVNTNYINNGVCFDVKYFKNNMGK